MMNEFFFYVFSKVSSWQSMIEFQVTTLDDITQLIMNSSSTEQALDSSKSGLKMPGVPCVYRYFAVYLTSFVAVASFFRSKDPCVALKTDKFFAKALDTLADVNDKNLSVYLHSKATAWYLHIAWHIAYHITPFSVAGCYITHVLYSRFVISHLPVLHNRVAM